MREPTKQPQARPPAELIDARDVRPAVTWTTLARAERLAHQGAGWTADQVMRRALDMLERAHLEGRPS